METRNVLMWTGQLQLLQYVVTHASRGARRKRRNRAVGKIRAQLAQLPILRTKLVSPLRNTVGLIDREKRNWHPAQPCDCLLARQTFRRKIEQPILACPRFRHDARLLSDILRAV